MIWRTQRKYSCSSYKTNCNCWVWNNSVGFCTLWKYWKLGYYPTHLQCYNQINNSCLCNIFSCDTHKKQRKETKMSNNTAKNVILTICINFVTRIATVSWFSQEKIANYNDCNSQFFIGFATIVKILPWLYLILQQLYNTTSCLHLHLFVNLQLLFCVYQPKNIWVLSTYELYSFSIC